MDGGFAYSSVLYRELLTLHSHTNTVYFIRCFSTQALQKSHELSIAYGDATSSPSL